MKIKLLILIPFLALFGCNNSSNNLSLKSEEKAIIKEIINDVRNNLKIENKSYLVDPLFNKFEFNSYTHNYRNELLSPQLF